VNPEAPDRVDRRVVPAAVALLALAVVLLDSAADLLPDAPLVWVVTPVRVVVGTGLVAGLLAVPPPRWRTGLDLPVALLLAAAALATVAAGRDWSGWRGVLTGVAVFALAVAVRRSALGSPHVIGLLAAVGTAIAATTALHQGLTGAATGFCRGALGTSADVCGPGTLVRVVGTFANPNLLAAFLVLLLPIAAAGVAGLGDRASRLVGTGLVVLGYGAVLWTVSRGAMLGAVASLAVFVLVRRTSTRRVPRLVAALAGPVVVLVLLLVGAGGAVGVRGDVWSAAVRLLLAHPLGVGPGEAGPLLTAAVAGDEQFQHAHDLWLNWALETGFVGLAAILALTAGAAVLCRRALRGPDRPFALALACGLAGFAVIGLADHPANALRVSLVLWAVLGLLAGTVPAGTVLFLPRRRAGQRPNSRPSAPLRRGAAARVTDTEMTRPIPSISTVAPESPPAGARTSSDPRSSSSPPRKWA
jgi:hypothetical protein